ncbi:MAG: hypothetical protein KKC19_03590, partial [Nanoarchaeota archaeon]|nr:hypothetical protein [Nanoarchaeota archaeon]
MVENKEEPAIPGMSLSNNYSIKMPPLPESSEKVQKELDKTKKELEKVKSILVKKYPFIHAIGILPKQALKLFIDEDVGENIPEEEFK